MIDEAHRRQARRILSVEAAGPAPSRAAEAQRAPRTTVVAAPYADELEVGQVFDAPGLTLDTGLATLHRAALRGPPAARARRRPGGTGDRRPRVAGPPGHGRRRHHRPVHAAERAGPRQPVLPRDGPRPGAARRTTLRTQTEVVAIEPTRDGARAKVTLRATTTDAGGKLIASYLRCPLLPARTTVEAAGAVPEAPLDIAVPDWDLDAHPRGEPLVAGDGFDVESHETVTLAPELARATLNLAMTPHGCAGGRPRTPARLRRPRHRHRARPRVPRPPGPRHRARLALMRSPRSRVRGGPAHLAVEVVGVDGPVVDLKIVLSNEGGDVLDWRPAVLYAA